ncbi:unnamed protein product [Scytosiphon promiscuus]
MRRRKGAQEGKGHREGGGMERRDQHKKSVKERTQTWDRGEFACVLLFSSNPSLTSRQTLGIRVLGDGPKIAQALNVSEFGSGDTLCEIQKVVRPARGPDKRFWPYAVDHIRPCGFPPKGVLQAMLRFCTRCRRPQTSKNR